MLHSLLHNAKIGSGRSPQSKWRRPATASRSLMQSCKTHIRRAARGSRAVTEQRRVTCIAPPDKYRLIEWVEVRLGHCSPRLVDDFKDYQEAKTAAEGLPAASVFASSGRAVFQKLAGGRSFELCAAPRPSRRSPASARPVIKRGRGAAGRAASSGGRRNHDFGISLESPGGRRAPDQRREVKFVTKAVDGRFREKQAAHRRRRAGAPTGRARPHRRPLSRDKLERAAPRRPLLALHSCVCQFSACAFLVLAISAKPLRR